MSKCLKALVLASLLASVAAPGLAEGFGLGRDATPGEIAAWDLDVSPDGTGLPEGRGDVLTGEELFSDRCAACHGEFAEGVDNWPELAGGEGTLADKDPVKTVGSYWPYLSTVWDYVNRSMPFGAAQTLEDDEVYAIVAYILYSNDLVDEDFELSHENFLSVELPNVDGFIQDDRDGAEMAEFRAEPCMSNCKDIVEITMRAAVLDVTPEDETSAEAEKEAELVQVAAMSTPEPEPQADPKLVADGEKVFRKCKACHQIGDGAKHRTGPHLNGIIGRTAGTAEGFRYSKAMMAAGDDGLVWTRDEITEFLTKPNTYVKGTKMSFAGLKKDADLAAINAYLSEVGG